MHKIYSSRGMGKTTQLLNLAVSSSRAGNKVVIISPSSVEARYTKQLIPNEKIVCVSLRDYLRDKPAYSEYQVFVDELDSCLASVLPQLQAYTLTIGE